MVFLGYAEGTKTYRLYDPRGDKVLVSRDVVFDEKAVLAHRITGSGESTTHQSCRALANVAEHPLAMPITNKRCPITHTMAKVEEEEEHIRLTSMPSLERRLAL